jgi:hypothetical protein
MSPLILIALVGGGLALLSMHDKPSSANTLPAAWKPPTDAKVEFFAPPFPGTGLAQLKRTSWHVAADASGQQAGTFVLTQNAANANDWIMAFKNDASGGGGILAYSQTPVGGMLAQAAAAGL